MTRARKHQVCVESTPYYHCISRCVRRAFLCGEDRFTGKSFDHRKEWLVERMRALSAVFAVDICAYAVMSNHFHLVVRVAPERVESWDDEELLERLALVFGPTARLIRTLSARARKQALAPWRARLADLSWFMRCLNESIARRANREDGCTGRFWEGRFKSQALLDEGALITCMSYVDLNPVRAGLAKTLEEADFTSIRERLSHGCFRRRRSSRSRPSSARRGRRARRRGRRHPPRAPPPPRPISR
jgi:REP element-mobilizing transposase RayT